MFENNSLGMDSVTSVALRLATLCLLLPPIPVAAAPESTNPTDATDTAPAEFAPFNPFLEEEAPPSVFQIGPESEDVDLYLLGNWVAGSRVALGIAFHPALADGSRVTFPYAYPGFETELFGQTVDMTLSLWLYRTYFFEATFYDDSLFNSVLLGYRGSEEAFVQEAMVGRGPFGISAYPYVPVGDGRGTADVPGISARFRTDRTEHEVLLNLEGSFPVVQTYAGTSPVNETRIVGSNFVRAAGFALPDGSLTTVAVALEDDQGALLETDSTRRYRLLDTDEYVVDTADGEIILAEPAATRVLVYYETSAGAVGAAANGGGALVPRDGTDRSPTTGSNDDFSFDGTVDYTELADYRALLSDGRDWLVLHDPTLFPLFENGNLYALDDGRAATETTIQVVERGSRRPADTERYAFELRQDGRYIQVIQAGTAPRSAAYRFPFADTDSFGAAIYGGNPPAASPVDLLVTARTEGGEYFIESDAVPGTVEATVNGRPVPGVRVDYYSGAVEFPDTPRSTDLVEISYRRNDPQRTQPQVVAAIGNRWNASDTVSTHLAGALRWNVWTDGYSTVADQNPGFVSLSTGVAFDDVEGRGLAAEAALSLQLLGSDTTGYLRLLSMESEEATIRVSPSTLFPAATPASLDSDDRIDLKYRDYQREDAFGNVILEDYTGSGTLIADASPPRIGPYLAGNGDAPLSGAVAIMEWDDFAAGRWSGIQLQNGAALRDGRSIESIELALRFEPDDGVTDLPADATLLFQIGALREDLDGDGNLDEGESRLQPELPFTTPGGVALAGTRRPDGGDPYSEDANGNGILDAAEPAAIATFDLADDLRTGGVDRWTTVTIDLPDADRVTLPDVRALRLVLASGATGIPAGRLMASRAVLETRSAATVAGGGSGTVAVTNVVDPLLSTASLRESRAVVSDVFHPDGGGSQRVAKMRWSGIDAADGEARFRTETTPFSRNDYATLRLFAYAEDLSSYDAANSEMIIRAASSFASDAEALEVRVATDDVAGDLATGWSEISIDTDSGSVAVNGRNVPASATLPAGDASLRLVDVAVTRSASGTLYLDELHGADPRWRTGVGGHVELSWSPDWVLTAGGDRALMSAVSLTQFVSLQNDAFRNTEGGSGIFSSRTEASATFLQAPFSTETFVSVTDDAYRASFSHDLALPLFGGRVVIDDGYRRSYRFAGEYQARLMGVDIRPESTAVRFSGDASLRQDGEYLRKQWAAQISAGDVRRGTVAIRAEESGWTSDLTAHDYATSLAVATADLFREERLGAESRSVVFSPEFTDGALNVGIHSGWTNEADTNGTQTDSIDGRAVYEWSPPGRVPWRIAPRFDRSFSTTEASDSASFSSDAAGLAKTLGRTGNIYGQAPVIDIFRHGVVYRGDSEARAYRAAMKIDAARPPGSRPRYLYLPAELSAEVSRNARFERATLIDSRTWTVGYSAIAINVWGSDAADPRVRWYRGDEFRNSATLEVEEPLSSEGSPIATAELESGVLLIRADESAIDYAQNVAVTRGGATPNAGFSADLAYRWRSDRYPRLRAFERFEQEPYVANLVSIGVETAFSGGDSTGTSVSLFRESTLILGRNGAIRAYGELAWTVEPFGDSHRQHLLGLLLGIEGSLSF